MPWEGIDGFLEKKMSLMASMISLMTSIVYVVANLIFVKEMKRPANLEALPIKF